MQHVAESVCQHVVVAIVAACCFRQAQTSCSVHVAIGASRVCKLFQPEDRNQTVELAVLVVLVSDAVVLELVVDVTLAVVDVAVAVEDVRLMVVLDTVTEMVVTVAEEDVSVADVVVSVADVAV